MSSRATAAHPPTFFILFFMPYLLGLNSASLHHSKSLLSRLSHDWGTIDSVLSAVISRIDQVVSGGRRMIKEMPDNGFSAVKKEWLQSDSLYFSSFPWVFLEYPPKTTEEHDMVPDSRNWQGVHVCVRACVSVMECTDTNEMGHALCWEEVQGDEGPRGGIEMLHCWHGARGWKGVVGVGFAFRGKITLIAVWVSSQNCSKIEGYCRSPRKRWIRLLVQTEKSSWFKNCWEVKTGGLVTHYYGEWGWGRRQDHTSILVWVTGWLVMLLDETWFLEEIRMGGLERDSKIPVLWVWDALGSFKGRC